ncbi:MAG: pilus assembly protein [Propionibacteriaceae bacterium]|nr:pilus assembly protein [Propionibacteriaceae bacterium]
MTGFKRERGAAAVEFALLLPLLMMLLLAIMEFGYAFFIQATVAGAARVGVRHYVVNYNSNDPTTAANASATAIELAKSAVPDRNLVVGSVFTAACAGNTQTTFVLTYKYQTMTGLLDPIVGKNLTVTGKGSMQCGG